MGRYFRGGVIHIWVVIIESECSLSHRAFAVLMFLWLFHARPLVIVCVCYGFNVYTGLYTSMGRYNRELSVRWSFGSLYARG